LETRKDIDPFVASFSDENAAKAFLEKGDPIFEYESDVDKRNAIIFETEQTLLRIF